MHASVRAHAHRRARCSHSICFPVDASGELGRGVTATHWYRLGPGAAGRIPASATRDWEEHPQSGYLVAGEGGWGAGE